MSDKETYEHDVFISYACAENEIPAGASDGWVTVFVRTLKQELAKTSLGKRVGVRVWWDEKSIDRTEDLQKQLIATLPRVRTMIVLLSPAYMESDWCRQEREAFISAMSGRPLGDKRVFLIDLGKVDPKERPEAFRGPLGFKFYDQDGRKFGHPLPNVKFERHLAFFDAVPSIAEELAKRLEELGVGTEMQHRVDDGPPPDPIATVYLAETTEDLDDQRREVALDLKQHGFRVIPERRLSSELDRCRQQIEQLIEQSKAQVFVQLLEAKLGKAFDESEETLVTLQDQIARERKMTVLQWRSRDIDLEKVSIPRLKTLLANPDVYSEPLEAFKAEVRAKATPPKPKHALPQDRLPSGRLPPAVFVQSDTADLSAAERLSDLLKCLQFRSWWPKSSDDPEQQADYREMQQEWLEDCDAIVFLHGIAKPSKVELQMQRIWKTQQKRQKPLRLKALYLGPPPGQTRPSLSDPQFIQIDGSADPEWNVAKLEPVLSTLWEEVQP